MCGKECVHLGVGRGERGEGRRRKKRKTKRLVLYLFSVFLAVPNLLPAYLHCI